MTSSDHPRRVPFGTEDPTAQMVRRCRHCGAEIPASSMFCSKCGGTAGAPAGPADPLRDRVQALFGTELEIERELGRGGMAAVYAAFDPALQRRVAVKVLLPDIADDQAMAERFLREARTVAALQHPHVVTVYSVRGGEGAQAIVMQLVEGRSLDVVLKERGRLPLHVAGLLLAHTAEGLQHAHDRGVIHRDVKPANVLIDADGRAVVSDFGIARRDDGPRTTGTGLVVGTWAYMSPEQRSAQRITAATDQYAFGVMAFEVLAGELPFRGTAGEMMRAHLNDPVPSLRVLRPEVPEHVDAAVRRMMAKDPSERWPSLKDVERIFHKLVPDEGQTTLQMAAYSLLPTRSGSSVVMAAPPLAPAPTRGAQPVAPVAAAPVVAPVVAPAAAPSVVAARWPLAVAALGLLALAGGWAVTHRSKAAPSPIAASQPAVAPAVSRAADATQDGKPPLATGTAARPASGATAVAPSATAPASSAAPSGDLTPSPLAGGTSAATSPAVRVEEPAASRREPEAPPARAMPAYALADARRLGREFVTLLNQRRARDVAQFAMVGGDAAARAELLKLTESAADFAAGFDRVPATPDEWTNGFQTEFYLDLSWRGAQKIMRIRLFASPADGAWRTVGFAADIP